MFLPGTHFCTIFISYLLLPFYPNFLTFVGNTHTKSSFFIWNLAFRFTSNNFPFGAWFFRHMQQFLENNRQQLNTQNFNWYGHWIWNKYMAYYL